MPKPVLVIKFGTSSITNSSGDVDQNFILDIARQISILHQKYSIVIVSSGAVGTGKHSIQNYTGKIAERKAAAAVGNPLLIALYSQAFKPYGITIAQSLCERRHFSDRKLFLELRETYQTLWENKIIPIANENDVVSTRELKFSDNDELATRLAIGFGAEKLMIGTAVSGLLDKNNNLVQEIKNFNTDILALASKEKTSVGLGGMVSKLYFSKLATSMGIQVNIFQSKGEDHIVLAEKNAIGTVCIAKKNTKNARQKWLASGTLIAGKIIIDKGAALALTKRKSLLSVGLKNIITPFENGDVIEIMDENDEIIAIAQTKIAASDINLRSLEKVVVAHVNDIVLL